MSWSVVRNFAIVIGICLCVNIFMDLPPSHYTRISVVDATIIGKYEQNNGFHFAYKNTDGTTNSVRVTPDFYFSTNVGDKASFSQQIDNPEHNKHAWKVIPFVISWFVGVVTIIMFMAFLGNEGLPSLPKRKVSATIVTKGN